MNAATTLNQLFFNAVKQFNAKPAALRYKAGGTWHDISHAALATRVKQVALGLKELGIERGDRAAILSGNRPEWAIADYACLTVGIADVAVYPTLTPTQVAYILRDSGASAVFVEDDAQFDRLMEVRNQLPDLRHVITIDPSGAGREALSFDKLAARGAEAEGRYPDYEREALAVEPDRVATLIYTSGTTGEPKGVMLTHGNIASNVRAALEALQVGPRDGCLSFLPLSHSFERTAGYYTMLAAGVTISYAESFNSVPLDLMDVRPTVVISVPRVYEKMYARVLETALAGGAVKRRIFFWARSTAEAWADLVLAGKSVPLHLSLKKRIADRLVFAKFRARTGGQLRFFVSGGAPLVPEIARFFFGAGLPILEGYGMTESSPIISVNPLEAPRLGTVGPPLPGIEIAIADDGEILARGPNVMIGYYNNPGATKAAVTEDGWLHTGDIGELDEAGYLKITDRKKDIVVTAGGKNIAPQPIENRVKTSAFVANAVLIADRRKFAIMLIVPDIDAVRSWARERKLSVDEAGDLLKSPDVVAKIEREVMLNLRDLANYQIPKRIVLIEEDFSIEQGEITPTLKVKRNVVAQRYKDRIDEAYNE